MSMLKSMTDWDRLEEMIEDDERKDCIRKVNEPEFIEFLRSRVKGQDAIIADVARLVRLQMAKRNRSKPLCSLLFLGPTGTGKTELAKAICEYLYRDEKNMLRFDCSELNSGHSKDRLIGMPLGYVGAEQGGQLTRPVAANPRRLILFDEIEKAYKGFFDLFLQLMGEARLTEQGSGKTVDFSECVIVLTSNALTDAVSRIVKATSDPVERLNAVKTQLADADVFRPEIVGRIDKMYVFEPLEGKVVAEIAMIKIAKLAQEYGLNVSFVKPELVLAALRANKKISKFGVRELERIIFDMFAEQFTRARDEGQREIALDSSSMKDPEVVARKAG